MTGSWCGKSRDGAKILEEFLRHDDERKGMEELSGVSRR